MITYRDTFKIISTMNPEIILGFLFECLLVIECVVLFIFLQPKMQLELLSVHEYSDYLPWWIIVILTRKLLFILIAIVSVAAASKAVYNCVDRYIDRMSQKENYITSTEDVQFLDRIRVLIVVSNIILGLAFMLIVVILLLGVMPPVFAVMIAFFNGLLYTGYNLRKGFEDYNLIAICKFIFVNACVFGFMATGLSGF